MNHNVYFILVRMLALAMNNCGSNIYNLCNSPLKCASCSEGKALKKHLGKRVLK